MILHYNKVYKMLMNHFGEEFISRTLFDKKLPILIKMCVSRKVTFAAVKLHVQRNYY